MGLPDFEALAQPGIQRLRAYDPGHDIVALRRRFAGQDLVELGSNENPYGPSPLARAAFLEAAETLHRYPDPLGSDLKRALASHLGLEPAQILLGNGSHELLMMVAQVFAGPSAGVVASEYGFAVYAIAAQAAGAPFTKAPALGSGEPMARGHDLEAIAACVTESTRLVYLANPNNPTGTWFTSQALADFMGRLRPEVLVVVDEAYMEFVDDPELGSALGLLPAFPNLVVTRTFSKAYGLAGLRVGLACGHPALLGVIERARESFNVNGAGLPACAAALSDQQHVRTVCAANADERGWLAGQLRQRGLAVGPSQTNFLLADFGRPAADIESALIAAGVVLRPMLGYGLPTCLRITVGRRTENLKLLAALDGVLA